MTRNASASNEEIASVLERVAHLLEAQGADVFRVGAYNIAAQTVRDANIDFASLVHEPVAMMAFPGIGSSISRSIQEYVATGHLRMLDRLEGGVSPEDLFMTVPGIGEALAHTIHETLHIETLEELELAAHDGRLDTVPGFSERRIAGIRNSLQAILTRSVRSHARRVADAEDSVPMPPIELLLEIDAEYRKRASGNALPTIAPRRFNPLADPWLPIMHVNREDWHFTVLYSNSARAHRLSKTRDWVIIFYEKDGHEDQCTVVTEHVGPLAGQRVVRSWQTEGMEMPKRSGEMTPPSPVMV
jgi:hypothetical protein